MQALAKLSTAASRGFWCGCTGSAVDGKVELVVGEDDSPDQAAPRQGDSAQEGCAALGGESAEDAAAVLRRARTKDLANNNHLANKSDASLSQMSTQAGSAPSEASSHEAHADQASAPQRPVRHAQSAALASAAGGQRGRRRWRHSTSAPCAGEEGRSHSSPRAETGQQQGRLRRWLAMRRAQSTPPGLTRRQPSEALSRASSPPVRKAKRKCSIVMECKTLPTVEVAVSRKCKPLASQKIKGATVPQIRKLLEAEQGPLRRFMQESLGCQDLKTSPWVEVDLESAELQDRSSQGTITRAHRSRYRIPLPDDIPDLVASTLRLPPALTGATLTSLSASQDQLVMVQQSGAEGVLYSDRFRIQTILVVRADAASGGVEVCQRGEIVWSQPLPWTHGLVGKIVEKRTMAEVRERAHDFLRILTAALQ